jgi:Sec63 Brl domain
VCLSCLSVQGLLEILASASEFDDLPMRPGDEEAVRKLLMHAPVAVDAPKYTDPHTKANALLQVRAAGWTVGRGPPGVKDGQIQQEVWAWECRWIPGDGQGPSRWIDPEDSQIQQGLRAWECRRILGDGQGPGRWIDPEDGQIQQGLRAWECRRILGDGQDPNRRIDFRRRSDPTRARGLGMLTDPGRRIDSR